MCARVSILMATYQGERFLKAQLESFRAQDFTCWDLYVSDDGSTDATIEIIKKFGMTKAEVRVIEGPRQGFQRNFMHLIETVPTASEYYAFSDQDDVWSPTRISRAVAWMKAQPQDVPLVYCSRTRNVDEYGREVGFSPLHQRKPSFKNALVQSIAGGNTMLINRAMIEVLRRVGAEVAVPSHDWWIYIVATGVGGQVMYDPAPTVDYRQHENNQVGANTGLRAKFTRLRMLIDGQFRGWTEAHMKALRECEHLLTAESQKSLRLFQKVRLAPWPLNLVALLKGGFRRQSSAGNIALVLAVMLKKI